MPIRINLPQANLPGSTTRSSAKVIVPDGLQSKRVLDRVAQKALMASVSELTVIPRVCFKEAREIFEAYIRANEIETDLPRTAVLCIRNFLNHVDQGIIAFSVPKEYWVYIERAEMRVAVARFFREALIGADMAAESDSDEKFRSIVADIRASCEVIINLEPLGLNQIDSMAQAEACMAALRISLLSEPVTSKRTYSIREALSS